MALKVAFQMDPIERIDIRGDSTFALLLEAQWRGHDVFYYTPNNLSLRDGKLIAEGHSLTVEDKPGAHYRLAHPRSRRPRRVRRGASPPGPAVRHGLYHHDASAWSGSSRRTLVVNDPAAVRNAPEKVFVLDFLDLMPPTLVTRSPEQIRAFRDKHKDIVVKPLYGNGGAAIFRITPGDTNLNSLIELMGISFREPIMVQRYLPEVREGDKRIILVDGEIAGAINRVPASDETRSNLHVGGTAQPTTLTKRDKEICARLGPELKKRGLIFTGIDVIGDYLTEINVTSPTGIRQIAAVRRRRRRRHDLGRGREEGEGRAAQGARAMSVRSQGARRGVRRPYRRRVQDARHRGDHGDDERGAACDACADHDRRLRARRRAALLRHLVHRPLARGHGRHAHLAHRGETRKSSTR